MSLHQVNSAFNLLGQTQGPAESVHLPGPVAPTLNVSWGAFRQSAASNLWAVLSGPSYSRKYIYSGVFRDCWIEGRIPRLALLVALILHVAVVVIPFPRALTAYRHNSAFDNFQLTWSGPINDLPLLNLTSAHGKPAARSTAKSHSITAPPEPPAFHPRQRIFTDSAHPTHPRQTLINPAAPMEAPKMLPALPNIVQLQQSAGPVKPRMQIDQQALAKLRPHERRAATRAVSPPTDAPVFQQQQADLTIQASASGPARPKLALNAGAAPRLAQRTQSGDASAAPELSDARSATTAAAGSPSTLIALSSSPAPPAAEIPVPQGNLAARVAISPEGKPGAAGGPPTNSAAEDKSGSSPGSTSMGANAPVTVSISGGSPSPKTNTSGLGGGNPASVSPKLDLSGSRGSLTRRPSQAESDETQVRTGPPNFAALPPGAKPEAAFLARKIYTLYVNMPNLNSTTGSWILNFSELRTDAGSAHLTPTTLAAPVPTKKVDPKYPPTLAADHVEGEIVLYGVIRRDGSIDSIQLVHGLDEQLDANSMSALSQWKFRPATRENNPVELEAIVHIPFHATTRP
jgi:TonB family protein